MSITDARQVKPEEWTERIVADVMPRPPLVAGAMARRLMTEPGSNQVVVPDREERLVGLLARDGVMRYLRLREKLRAEPTRVARRVATEGWGRWDALERDLRFI